MSRIKAAIFDMDGLLFDTERVFDVSWLQVAKKHDIEISQKMTDELRGTSGVVMKGILAKYFKNTNIDELVDELYDGARDLLKIEVPLKPGVFEILDYCKTRDFKLAIASSSPSDLVQSNLKVSNLQKYFDVVVCGKDVKVGKPAPDIFILTAEKMNVLTNECYVFEDGINGVMAGISAGCSTIMIPDMLEPTQEAIDGCVGIYKTLLEAKTAIEKGII